MSSAGQVVRFIVSALAVGVIGGCASKPPPPLMPPPAYVTLSHFSGTPLSGATPQVPSPLTADEALAVHVTLIAVEKMPRGAMTPLGPQARLISAAQGGQAVLPSSRLTLGARLGTGATAQDFIQRLYAEEFGRYAEVKQLVGALPRGVTVDMQATDPAPPAEPGAVPYRRIEILVCRRPAAADAATAPSEQIELAVAICDLPQPSTDIDASAGGDEGGDLDQVDNSTDANAFRPSVQREIAIVDGLMIEDRLFGVLLLPFAFADSLTEATVAVIEVSPPAEIGESHAAAFEQCVDDLKRSGTEAAEKRAQLTSTLSADWPGFETAIAALDQPSMRRGAIAFLSSQTGASICEDVALVADELLLEQLGLDLRTALTAQASLANDARTRESLGWLLDLTCFRLLGRLQAENKLPAELSSILTIHAGEAGRDSGSMEVLTKDLTSRVDLEGRLIAENYIYLEDPSPAARVRAYDWLSARQRAPEGYDPLDSVRERRQAIDQALDAQRQDAAVTQQGAP